MRSWKMPSRAAFDIDILVMAAPEYLDIVSRGRWPQSSRLLSRAWRDHGPETIRPDRILPEGLWLFAVLGFRGQSILLSVSAGLALVSLIVVVAIMYRYMVMA
jgi:hypothetical protein